MTACLLDASAVLALIRREPGEEVVRPRLAEARLAAVNLAEVLAKHVDHGADPRPVRRELEQLGVTIVPVLPADAELQAAVRARDAERPGVPRLPLADRLCLAVALRLELPVLTADAAWLDLDLPVAVELIR